MYIEDCGQCEFDETHDNVHVLIVGLISDLIFFCGDHDWCCLYKVNDNCMLMVAGYRISKNSTQRVSLGR